MSGTTWSPIRPMAMSSAPRSPRAGSRRSISRAAKAAPGVLAIVTADNAGKLGKGDFNTAKLLGGPEIEHYHQAIAVVVAETFEQARAAAQLVRVDYTPRQGRVRSRRRGKAPRQSRSREVNGEPDTAVGDFDGALRRRAGQARRDLHHARPERMR